MRLMVVSDIHGSLSACESSLNRFFEEKADKLLILGDILYHGPRNSLPGDYNPKEVARRLNEYKDRILGDRGNCDTEVDQMMLDFPIMADYIYVVVDDLTIFATHGHHYSPERPPQCLPIGSILMTGHTHIACDALYNDYRYMNPGSPSIPKGGSVPSYIIVDKGEAKLIAF